jgi:hypothetical protein
MMRYCCGGKDRLETEMVKWEAEVELVMPKGMIDRAGLEKQARQRNDAIDRKEMVNISSIIIELGETLWQN